MQLLESLFATGGHDLRALMREGRTDQEISTVIVHLWRARTDQYSALRTRYTSGLETSGRKVEMSYIGG